jgi:hypothetical protein
MQPPSLLSAILLVPLVLPGVLPAQEATRRHDQDAAVRGLRTAVRSLTGSVVAQERTPDSDSQGTARQGLAGTEHHYQPGWNDPLSWPMNSHPFTGGDLYSDGGFQPFDGLHGPPDSFWFYQPSTNFYFYQPSTNFWFYRPSPSFWFYRPHGIGHPHH